MTRVRSLTQSTQSRATQSFFVRILEDLIDLSASLGHYDILAATKQDVSSLVADLLCIEGCDVCEE